MAIPMIETGYKPEFGLGAVYQGFNAANADQSAMLDQIRDYLAANKSFNEQPYDLAAKQYEGALADAKRTDADYIPWQLKGQIGQMKTQDASGERAQLLQPFLVKSEQAKLQNEQTQNELEGQMQNLLQTSQDQSVPEAQRIAALERHMVLADQLKNTPKFLGQKELLDDKLQMQLAIAELNRQKQEAGKRSASETAWVNYQKSSPEVRLGISKSAIETGVNPFTREPLTEQEKAMWKLQYSQDVQTLNAKAQSSLAGKPNVGAMTQGKVPTFQVPDFGSSQGTGGQTSSGVKFKVVQ